MNGSLSKVGSFTCIGAVRRLFGRKGAPPATSTVVEAAFVMLCALLVLGKGQARAAEPPEPGPSGAEPAVKKVRRPMMDYVPPGAIGVIHVDVDAVREHLKGAFQNDKEAAEEFHAKAICSLAAKVDTFECFFLGHAADPIPILVFYGTMAPKDLVDFCGQVGTSKAGLKEVGAGQYDLLGTPFRILRAQAPKGVVGQVLVVGPTRLLTDMFVARMGKGQVLAFTALLGKVNKKNPIWGAVLLFDESSGTVYAPKSAAGSMNVGERSSLRIEFVFRTEEAAEAFARELTGGESLFAKLFLAKRTGSVVAVGLGQRTEALAGVLQYLAVTRRRTRRLVFMGNLKAIGMGIAAYMEKHGNVPPPSLQVLLKECFISPAWEPKPGSDNGRMGSEPKLSDFVYIVLPKSANGMLIRAYVKPEKLPGQGTCVLLADSSVKWLKMKDFRALLKKTEAWLRKEPGARPRE